MVLNIQVEVFWNVTPCSAVVGYEPEDRDLDLETFQTCSLSRRFESEGKVSPAL